MKKLGKIVLMMLAMWTGSLAVSAQNTASEGGDSAAAAKPTMYIAPETEALFQKLMPQRDSSFMNMAKPKDGIDKRFSLHFNMLDWALTVPNIGVEFDLDKTAKNNKSVLLFGEFKPKMSHNYQPSVVFNVMSIRAEFRKYWRTGSIGLGRVNHNIPKMKVKRPKKQTRTEYIVDNFDSIPNTVEYYATAEDSAMAKEFNGDPNRGKFYNRYLQFRRNVTSTRTVKNPRNWRAYYVGGYFGVDKWDICFNKKGKEGKGINLGVSAGWTIPLLTRKFPNEGGLDLDLGGLLGLKVVKYDAYSVGYDAADNNRAIRVETPEKSKTSWSFVKWPVLQELRVGLVYRFRSISRKVSLALIDEYEKKWVSDFNDRIQKEELEHTNALSEKNEQEMKSKREALVAADSTSFWNNWHEHRLINALKLNPDTVFTGQDEMLFIKLIESKKPKLSDKEIKEQKKAAEREAKEAERLAKEAEKAAKKAGKNAKKDAEKADSVMNNVLEAAAAAPKETADSVLTNAAEVVVSEAKVDPKEEAKRKKEQAKKEAAEKKAAEKKAQEEAKAAEKLAKEQAKKEAAEKKAAEKQAKADAKKSKDDKKESTEEEQPKAGAAEKREQEAEE